VLNSIDYNQLQQLQDEFNEKELASLFKMFKKKNTLIECSAVYTTTYGTNTLYKFLIKENTLEEQRKKSSVQDRWACIGKLEFMELSFENGCPWDENTCTKAASEGHLECLKYAHEHGCPWDENTCTKAALNGHLDSLKYAHEHGCPWDKNTCSDAASTGQLKCLKYAHEHVFFSIDKCISHMLNSKVYM
jgi:hypothetical protein